MYKEVCDIVRESPVNIIPFTYIKDAPEGLILEFGVWNGDSLNHIAGIAKPRKVYGFDWFQGLPEAWGPNHKGTFRTSDGKPPNFSSVPNIEIVVGLFQDTLPGFLETHPDKMAFVHLDCDLYSSAACILENIEKRLQPGTILAFDELIDYHMDLLEDNPGHWKNGEYKAFNELLARRPSIKWECLSRWAPHQVAIKILEV